MNKPVVFSILGAAAIGAGFWLAMRGADPAAAEKSATNALAATPAPLAGEATEDGRAARATGQPATAGESAAPLATNRDATSPPDSQSAALPIDVSPGFEFLVRPAREMSDTDPQWTTWRRHQQLESEPRDDNWAPRMETEILRGIEDSLTAAGLDTQRVELPVLECRTHGCEIQAVGYQADNRNPKADFQIIVQSVLRERLGDEFELQGLMVDMSIRPDGRIVFLVQVPRKKSFP
jgi:hypothetical protein